MAIELNLYTASQTRELDRVAIEDFGYSGGALMQRAGERAFVAITQHYSEAGSIVVLCGPGNNGGDGYVVADCALRLGFEVVVIRSSLPATSAALEMCSQYLDRGGKIIECDKHLAVDDAIHDSDQSDRSDCVGKGLDQEIAVLISGASLVVDGLLGTGLDRAPQGVIAGLIELTNMSSSQVLALDVPSGLNSDNGRAYEPCLKAQTTVTFIGQKLGCYTGKGKDYCGNLIYESLELPGVILEKVKAQARIIVPVTLTARNMDTHKGNFGNVVISGGDNGLLGATLLSGKAALRCGTGLVTVLSTDQHLDQPALHCPELMSASYSDTSGLSVAAQNLLNQCDVIVIGPGLGQSVWSRSMFQLIMTHEKSMVVDADGLNLLAENPFKNHNWVLTPHPGEAAQLLGCSAAKIQQDRITAIRRIHEIYGGVCILKGAGTLVFDGGDTIWLCDRGNSGMSTAGMGDVLSGVIGSLLGSGLSLLDAAKTAVWLHAAGADRIAVRMHAPSLLASDVISILPEMLAHISD